MPYTQSQARSLVKILLHDYDGVSKEAFKELKKLMIAFDIQDEFEIEKIEDRVLIHFDHTHDYGD